MPQFGNESPLAGAWSGGLLIALLAALGALGFAQAPFKPERPPEIKEGMRVVGEQDVDARLWQDPFAAVAEARKQGASACRSIELVDQQTLRISQRCPADSAGHLSDDTGGPHRLDKLAEGVNQRLSKRSQVLVLGIMTSGGPGAGAAEARRNARYAALSGLLAEGYEPRDPEHIGYAEPDVADAGLPQYIPYEWFSRDSPEPASDLLLLWLDDETLAAASTGQDPETGKPLARLTQLLAKLAPSSHDSLLRLQVIGPASSTTLQVMATEGRAKDPQCASTKTWHVQIWSPLATIPPAAGQDRAGLHPRCTGSIEILPPTANHRTIATDDALAELLAQELKARHVGPPAEVALVGQGDTAYSRALAVQVKEKLTERLAVRVKNELAHTVVVTDYRYLRGIDGLIPGAKVQVKPEGESKGIERPGGDSQVDYLRRLRDALLDRDNALRKGKACGFGDRLMQRCGIRAIGVLGNDYYDKLLVLQALRPVFPNALFFTTDLSADMLLPQDNPATRNLIVASGFGLSLHPDWQGTVPPLRNGYQTSILLGVRLAVRDAWRPCEPKIQIPPPPRLFEIGRTRAVELPPHGKEVGAWHREDSDPRLDPHPPEDLRRHYTLGPEGLPAAVLALLLTGILGLILSVQGWRRIHAGTVTWWADARAAKRPALAAGGLVLLLALALIAWVSRLELLSGTVQMAAELLALVAAVGLAGQLWGWTAIAEKTNDWWRQLWQSGDSKTFVAAWIVAAVVLTWILFFVLLAWDLSHGGEPFSLLEGVSVWPSEVLRLAAGSLALYLLRHGHHRFLEAIKRIEERFEGLAEVDPHSEQSQ